MTDIRREALCLARANDERHILISNASKSFFLLGNEDGYQRQFVNDYEAGRYLCTYEIHISPDLLSHKFMIRKKKRQNFSIKS